MISNCQHLTLLKTTCKWLNSGATQRIRKPKLTFDAHLNTLLMCLLVAHSFDNAKSRNTISLIRAQIALRMEIRVFNFFNSFHKNLEMFSKNKCCFWNLQPLFALIAYVVNLESHKNSWQKKFQSFIAHRKEIRGQMDLRPQTSTPGQRINNSEILITMFYA